MGAQTEIDWQLVGEAIRTPADKYCGSSTQLACAAIEYLLGAEKIAASVDHYVRGGPESELARSVLWHLHPWSAMQRCYEIYRTSAILDEQRSAVELLRVVADHRALPWISEFLADRDTGIQAWGVGVLDQLLWSRFVAVEECEDLLHMAEHHDNQAVRERAVFIREFLADRSASSGGEP